MRFNRAPASEMTGECDMTPMIDMTFQLIIFLMLMVNFSEADQSAEIMLPSSELARPPDRPLDKPIALNVLPDGQIIAGGQTLRFDELRGLLKREADAIAVEGKNIGDANIIIRGDGNTPVGTIQEVIKACQEVKFEKFALRAKEGNQPP